jgi:hypothetical protein
MPDNRVLSPTNHPWLALCTANGEILNAKGNRPRISAAQEGTSPVCNEGDFVLAGL